MNHLTNIFIFWKLPLEHIEQCQHVLRHLHKAKIPSNWRYKNAPPKISIIQVFIFDLATRSLHNTPQTLSQSLKVLQTRRNNAPSCVFATSLGCFYQTSHVCQLNPKKGEEGPTETFWRHEWRGKSPGGVVKRGTHKPTSPGTSEK